MVFQFKTRNNLWLTLKNSFVCFWLLKRWQWFWKQSEMTLQKKVLFLLQTCGMFKTLWRPQPSTCPLYPKKENCCYTGLDAHWLQVLEKHGFSLLMYAIPVCFIVTGWLIIVWSIGYCNQSRAESVSCTWDLVPW